MDLTSAKRVMLRTHVAALHGAHRANAIEMVAGPGIGKSDSVRQSCAELAAFINEPVGLVTFMLATVSSVDIRGFMLPIKNASGGMDSHFSVPPWYPTRANVTVFTPDGTTHHMGSFTGDVPRVGVLFLDEFAQAEDDVKKPAAELLLHGCVGTTSLPVGWRVLAASNRMSDRSGVMRAMAFITNRRNEIKVDASLPSWISWANAQPDATRPHYLTLSFAQKNPGLVFRDAVPPGSDPFCTPRTLCLLDADLKALRSPEETAADRMPTDAIAREVARGWIGEGEAAQFFTHIKYADELPEIDDLVAAPTKAKLPPNKDAQMVCGYMLAHHVNDKTAGPIMQYLGRLHIEMQVLAVNAIMSHKPTPRAVLEHPLFKAWLIANKDLLMASRS